MYKFDSDSDRKKFNEENSNVENSDEENSDEELTLSSFLKPIFFCVCVYKKWLIIIRNFYNSLYTYIKMVNKFYQKEQKEVSE